MTERRSAIQAALAPEYELRAMIGRGMSSRVYRARRRSDGRAVALKVLHPGASRALRERFVREAGLLMELRHEALVPLLGGDLSGPLPYLATAWFPGGDLAARTRPGSLLPRDEVLRAGVRVARALEHLHRNGILHRDVKPGNILRDAAGEAVLADLGLGTRPGEDHRLTRTGAVVGTPRYMAPELLCGGVPSVASDVYALGITLIELLLGAAPPPEVVAAGLADALLSDLGHARVRGVLARAIRLDPAARWQRAGELAVALEKAMAAPASPTSSEAPTVDSGSLPVAPTFGEELPPRPGRTGAVLPGAFLVAALAGYAAASGTPSPAPAPRVSPGVMGSAPTVVSRVRADHLADAVRGHGISAGLREVFERAPGEGAYLRALLASRAAPEVEATALAALGRIDMVHASLGLRDPLGGARAVGVPGLRVLGRPPGPGVALVLTGEGSPRKGWQVRAPIPGLAEFGVAEARRVATAWPRVPPGARFVTLSLEVRGLTRAASLHLVRAPGRAALPLVLGLPPGVPGTAVQARWISLTLPARWAPDAGEPVALEVESPDVSLSTEAWITRGRVSWGASSRTPAAPLAMARRGAGAPRGANRV